MKKTCIHCILCELPVMGEVTGSIRRGDWRKEGMLEETVLQSGRAVTEEAIGGEIRVVEDEG